MGPPVVDDVATRPMPASSTAGGHDLIASCPILCGHGAGVKDSAGAVSGLAPRGREMSRASLWAVAVMAWTLRNLVLGEDIAELRAPVLRCETTRLWYRRS